MAKTVPLPEVPPTLAVPNSVLPDKINFACRFLPATSGKLNKFVKPVPSVLTLNTVAVLLLIPLYCGVIPYSVLPDKTDKAPPPLRTPSEFVPVAVKLLTSHLHRLQTVDVLRFCAWQPSTAARLITRSSNTYVFRLLGG